MQGETRARCTYGVIPLFQSTLPMQGETKTLKDLLAKGQFQSTLPMQGETYVPFASDLRLEISIHSPRVRPTGTMVTFLHDQRVTNQFSEFPKRNQ